MKAALRRAALRGVETLVMGPAYARWVYWARSPRPLEPERTWSRFTRPGTRLLEWVRRSYPPALLVRLMRFYYRRTEAFKDHALGITSHYDVSNRFYALFLDERMFYSCADFASPGESLDDAQCRKARYLLELLDPQPGEVVLDLGCGWGGMLDAIHERTGDRDHLTGYTLSLEQRKFIEERLGLRVELRDFITREYEPESLDKIISIGAMEHVRSGELLPLARKLRAALRPSGRIVHQFFCQLGDDWPRRLIAGGFYIFPGSELSSLRAHLDAFEGAGLRVVHHSIHDYRPTLRAWFERLAANRDAAIQAVGLTTYNTYLCYFAEGWRLFQDRDLVIMRFALERA